MKTTYRLPCFVSTTSCIRATAVDGIDAQCAAPLDAHRRRALRLWMPIAVVRCASGCPSPSCAAPLDAHRRRALRLWMPIAVVRCDAALAIECWQQLIAMRCIVSMLQGTLVYRWKP